jgi:hypothetical protein
LTHVRDWLAPIIARGMALGWQPLPRYVSP